jgi:hypothetical protein
MNNTDEKTASLSLLLGPALLVAALLLIFYKAAFLIASPVWITGLGCALLLACAISYLSFREVLEREMKNRRGRECQEAHQKEIRSLLNETHALYRDKIAKLEAVIASLEEEEGQILVENEKEYVELQRGYESLFQENRELKNRTSSLHIALEDALDELRALRQEEYLLLQTQKRIPKDLPHRYRQLREQFDDKALALEQTRRRLFALEGQLLALKIASASEKLEANREEIALLNEVESLLDEKECLETEVALLEKLVLGSGSSKAAKKRAKKQLETMLEFQFDKPLSEKS